MLTPSDTSRERILLVGPWGSGKTKAWCEVARFYRLTSTPGTFYVLDTDYAAERNLQEYEGWNVNVDLRILDSWDDYVSNIEDARAKANREDWLIVDMIDSAWKCVRDDFVERVHGQKADEWFLSWRTNNPDSKTPALSGSYGINWDVINARYNRFARELQRFPGHVLACAKAEPISDNDSNEIRSFAGRMGIKPAGQKHTAFLFHTVLLLQERQQGEWVFTTMRDRSRSLVKAERMDSFVPSYLMKVGGWTT